jgi:serine/threonine protein kinase
MRQIVSAVDYIHRMGVVHRDLKLENIMISPTMQCKLIDFGLGNFYDLDDPSKLLDTYCGSPDYASPELLQSIPYHGPATDIWSLGVVCYTIATGFFPFNSFQHIVSISYSWPKNSTASADMRKFVQSIFQREKLVRVEKTYILQNLHIIFSFAQRATMPSLLSHPWLCGIEGPVRPHPMYSAADPDPFVLERVVALGLPEQMVVESVTHGLSDQFSATYELMQNQMGSRKNSDDLEWMELSRSSGEISNARISGGSSGSSPIDDQEKSDRGSRLSACVVM